METPQPPQISVSGSITIEGHLTPPSSPSAEIAPPVLPPRWRFWQWSRDFHTIYGTWILALGTWALAGLAYCTLQDNRDIATAGQRAWIAPVDARLDAAPFVNNVGESADVTITVTLQNTGKSPATDTVTKINGRIVTLDDMTSGKLKREANEYFNRCLVMPSTAGGEVYYPVTTANNVHEYHTRFTKNQIDWSMIYGLKLIIAQPCVAYMSFGKLRHSAACFMYQAGKTSAVHLKICGFGSHAD